MKAWQKILGSYQKLKNSVKKSKVMLGKAAAIALIGTNAVALAQEGGGGIFGGIGVQFCNISNEFISIAPYLGFAAVTLGVIGWMVANRDGPGWVVKGILGTAILVTLGTGFAATVGTAGCGGGGGIVSTGPLSSIT